MFPLTKSSSSDWSRGWIPRKWENNKGEGWFEEKEAKTGGVIAIKESLGLNYGDPWYRSSTLPSSAQKFNARETIRGEEQTDSNLIEHLKPSDL